MWAQLLMKAALLTIERPCTDDIGYYSGPFCEKVLLKVLHFE
jgi:hypothetical protein